MQEQYDSWTLFCPGKCKSAGTLVALGAQSLLMDIHSELGPLDVQMNPDIIGSENRDLAVATEYGDRLAKISKNAKSNAIARLVHLYPAHDFVIDMNEAKTLFKNVDYPSENLYKIVGALGPAAYNEAPNSIVCALSRIQNEDDQDEPSTDASETEGQPPLDGGGRADSAGDSGEGGSGGSGNDAAPDVAADAGDAPNDNISPPTGRVIKIKRPGSK